MRSPHATVSFLLAVLFAAAAQGETVRAATGRLSEKQREQLLQLRGIVATALKTARAIDYEIPEDKRVWNASEMVMASWWESRPIISGGIVIAALVLAVLLLLLLFCSPQCVHICSRHPGSEQRLSEKQAIREETPSAEGLTFRELPLGGAPPFGTIHYLMRYDLQTEQLLVTVKSCSDLPNNSGSAGSLDPYVVIRIRNSEAGAQNSEPKGDEMRASTPVVRNSASPEFNFTGSFQVARASLPKAVALFEVFDWSRAEKHAMVARYVHRVQDPEEGHLADNILASEDREFEGQLKMGHRIPNTGPGDICVLLQRGLSQEPLKVRIIECKGVYLKDSEGKVDERTKPSTYVDVTLTEPHGRIHAKRTGTVHKSRNPYYNEEFSFPVPPEKLRQCALRLTLVHTSDFLRAKKAVGTVELSSDAGEDNRLAREHWLAVTGGQPTSREHETRVAKCSWHYLVSPEEEMRLRTVRAFAERRRLQPRP